MARRAARCGLVAKLVRLPLTQMKGSPSILVPMHTNRPWSNGRDDFANEPQLLLPLSRFGFLLAISMGFLLFSADAAHVVRNPAFHAKLLLIAAALVNIVIAHVGPWRRVALWRAEASGGAKVTALVSLLLWLGAVCAGRLIAYF